MNNKIKENKTVFYFGNLVLETERAKEGGERKRP